MWRVRRQMENTQSLLSPFPQFCIEFFTPVNGSIIQNNNGFHGYGFDKFIHTGNHHIRIHSSLCWKSVQVIIPWYSTTMDWKSIGWGNEYNSSEWQLKPFESRCKTDCCLWITASREWPGFEKVAEKGMIVPPCLRKKKKTKWFWQICFFYEKVLSLRLKF